MLSPEVEKVIVGVLCSQALADHLGDVRDAEVDLWKLMNIDPAKDEFAYYSDSAWEATRKRLAFYNIALPEHLRDCDNEDE